MPGQMDITRTRVFSAGGTLRIELTLRPGARIAPTLAAGVVAAEALAQRLCAALWRTPGAWVQGQAAYLGRLGRRGPDLVGQGGDALQAAWALAHREALAHGQLQPPPGLRMASLGWALRGAAAADRQRHALTVAALPGATPADPAALVLRVQQATSAGPAPLVDMLRSPWTQVSAGDGAAASWLPAGAPHVLAAGAAVELRNGGRILVVERFAKPDWARALRCERGRWQAQAPDGRWLSWVPRCTVEMSGLAPQPGSHAHAPAAWWDADAALGMAPPAHRVPYPSWASEQGIDEFGLWAEFRVEGRFGSATQRLRWLPAGEFWMGSPEDEPERFEDERRHRVVLTQGLWLADTACTQALWQAVLGENPSRFSNDPENPVEQVSWLDITQRFLPALNALVPGLQATLPTEAQWEYACRAGTDTPYWFRAQVTTAQVNYDGDYPYAGGPKGEYREHTVRVKALPANGWGLHQMHGNVWEWCEDVMGEYPEVAAIDPRGPLVEPHPGGAVSGRRRVLRGGGWLGIGGNCRSAYRYANGPVERHDYFGFRLARGLAEPGPEALAGGAGLMRAEPIGLEPRPEREPPPPAAARPPPPPAPRRKGGSRR